MSRFMAYIWSDSDNPGECKFGDHWVDGDKTLEQAREETRLYVRSSVGRQKHKFDDGRICIHHYWDVSEYAQRLGKFYKNAKIDNVIRECIGFHIGSGDFHKISVDEAIIRVNKELARYDGLLPEVGLTTLQYQMLGEALWARQNGRTRILAELCARFGKTIWAGAVIVETGAPITVVASYVLTVFTSFNRDLSSYNQFKGLVHVESSEDNWLQTAKRARADGYQVVIYLSMCGGGSKHEKTEEASKRDERIRTIYSDEIDEPVLLIIDEADFGVHKENQAKPLQDAQRKGDWVILMTGTNADRAASRWNIDHYMSVTYPELLMMKARAEG